MPKTAATRVSFDVTHKETILIKAIVARAIDKATHLSAITGQPIPDAQEIEMDLTACHANGTPLDLAAMLNAKRGADFDHDVWGIRANIDRRTGKLRNYFSPRFAKREVR